MAARLSSGMNGGRRIRGGTLDLWLAKLLNASRRKWQSEGLGGLHEEVSVAADICGEGLGHRNQFPYFGCATLGADLTVAHICKLLDKQRTVNATTVHPVPPSFRTNQPAISCEFSLAKERRQTAAPRANCGKSRANPSTRCSISLHCAGEMLVRRRR